MTSAMAELYCCSVYASGSCAAQVPTGAEGQSSGTLEENAVMATEAHGVAGQPAYSGADNSCSASRQTADS